MRNTNVGLLSNNKARIFDNTISLDNNDLAIKIWNNGKWTIDANQIFFKNLNGGLSAFSGNGYGINLLNSGSNYLYDNKITDVGTKGNSTAFWIEASQNNRLCCNYTEGNSAGVQIVGGCNNADIKMTSFKKHFRALNYTGIKPLSGQQINKGNLFYVSSGEAFHTSNIINDVQKSKFTVKNVQQTEHPVKVNLKQGIPQTNFFDVNNQNSPKCTDEYACEIFPPQLTQTSELDVFVAEEGFGNNTQVSTTLQWESALDLMKRLDANPTAIEEHPSIAGFYKKNKSEILGRFAEIDQKVEAIDKNTEEIDFEIDKLQIHIEDIRNQMTEKYADLTNAKTWEDSLAVYDTIEEIGFYALDLNTMLDNTLLQVAQDKIVKAKELLPIIEELPTQDVADKNRKEIWRIYVKNIIEEKENIDLEQFETISQIAHQCMEEGGTAVLMARAMYQQREPKNFNDEELCHADIHVITKTVKSKSFVSGLELMPNPTKDNVNILVMNGEKQAFEITVQNLAGQTLKQIKNNGLENNIYQLDTYDYPSGIYICQLKLIDGGVITKKLIIQK